MYTYRKDVSISSVPHRKGVKIPPLGMVDDIAAVSLCGVESVSMNAFLNTKTNLKKLQFGVAKCKKMHVGDKQEKCPQLFIDKWKLDSVDSFSYSIDNYIDIEDGEIEMETTSNEKYLGMVISKTGSNRENIQSKISKGLGAIRYYYFEVLTT